MKLTEFRTLDYILFYLLLSTYNTIQISNSSLLSIFEALIGGIAPAIVLGTITNIIVKNTKK